MEHLSINPETVDDVRHWVRALLQGLARYGIATELEQAAGLRQVADELEAIVQSRSCPIPRRE